MEEITIQDIVKEASLIRTKHIEIFALAFQQALGCSLNEIELVEERRDNKIIWYFRKK